MAEHAHPFAEHMPAVARALLGEPNPIHSKPGLPRWGNKGSLAVDEEQGVFFDHEAGTGGGVMDLIKRVKGLTGQAAIEWMRSIGIRFEEKPRLNGKLNGAKANGKARPQPE